MTPQVCLSGFITALLWLAACGGEPKDGTTDYSHVLSFDTASIRLTTAKNTTHVVAELAESEDTANPSGNSGVRREMITLSCHLYPLSLSSRPRGLLRGSRTPCSTLGARGLAC